MLPSTIRKKRVRRGRAPGEKAQGGSGSYSVNTNRPHVAMCSLWFPNCWESRVLLRLEAGERHGKSTKVFLQRLRLSAWGRAHHGGLPRFWLRWFETASKCNANANSLCGGCLVGLESRDSFQVQDMAALGIALSNPKEVGYEIWEELGFFQSESAAGLHIESEKAYGYHCRAYQATTAVTLHIFPYL